MIINYVLLVSMLTFVSAHFQPNLQQVYQNPQFQATGQAGYQQPPNGFAVAPAQQQHPQQPHLQQQLPQQPNNFQPQSGGNILHDQQRIHDKEHIKEHLGGVISEPDMSKMSEEELQFHYFKMHDADNNNMLDGSELIKSLIHWHVEESKHLGSNAPPSGTTKIFSDSELAGMIDPILNVDDKNRDGFIDYPEFIAAQKSRGF